MSVRDLEALLKSTMGLDTATVGPATIERAVRERMLACALEDAGAYAERVRRDPAELEAFIEAVVVPETWFFRNPEAFSELARTIVLGTRRAAGKPLRLLSVPCSSGEEPYTIAMALLDARIPSDRFSIDAIDISAPLLVRARRGVYGSNSFRGADFAFRARFFEQTPDGYLIREEIRASVKFACDNIFAPDFLATAGTYDAIFCRNLLVYFDRSTQDRALSILRRLLAPRGMLFVGPAEAGLLFAHDFVWSKVPLSFSFVVAETANEMSKSAETPARSLPPRAREARARVATLPASPPQAPQPPQPPQLDFESSLSKIARLANAGQLAEASRACASHLRAFAPSSQAFYLRGTIARATGNVSEATTDLRKALYLEPAHSGALAALASLLEEARDDNGARMLRDRLERLQSGAKVLV